MADLPAVTVQHGTLHWGAGWGGTQLLLCCPVLGQCFIRNFLQESRKMTVSKVIGAADCLLDENRAV